MCTGLTACSIVRYCTAGVEFVKLFVYISYSFSHVLTESRLQFQIQMSPVAVCFLQVFYKNTEFYYLLQDRQNLK